MLQDILNTLGIDTERMKQERKPAARTPDVNLYEPKEVTPIKVFTPKQASDNVKRSQINETVKNFTNDVSDIGTALYHGAIGNTAPNEEIKPYNYVEGNKRGLEPQAVNQDRGGVWPLIKDKLGLNDIDWSIGGESKPKVEQTVPTQPATENDSGIMDSIGAALPYLSGPLASAIAGEGVGLGAGVAGKAMMGEYDRINQASDKGKIGNLKEVEVINNEDGRRILVDRVQAIQGTQSGKYSLPEKAKKEPKQLSKSNMVTVAPKGMESDKASHRTMTLNEAKDMLASGKLVQVEDQSSGRDRSLTGMYNVKEKKFGSYPESVVNADPTNFIKTQRYKNEDGLNVILVGNKEIPVSAALTSHLRGDKKKIATDLIKQVETRTVDLRDSVYNSKLIVDSLNGNTPIGETVALMNTAKTAQGGGKLSDKDVLLFSGTKEWNDMINRVIMEAKSGKMSAKGKLFMYHATALVAKKAKDEMSKRVNRLTSSTEKANKVKKGVFKNVVSEYLSSDDLPEMDLSNYVVTHPKLRGGKPTNLSKIPADKRYEFLNDLFKQGVGTGLRVKDMRE